MPHSRQTAQLLSGEWEPRCPRCGAGVTTLPTPESSELRPTSIYAVSKQAQEQTALVVGTARALPVVALRYFNVYGSRQSLSNPYTGVIPAFVGRALDGHPPEVYEDGRESRDFVHVSDVVRATLLAVDDRATDPRVMNVGSGTTRSLLEVARAVTAALGGPEPVVTGKFRVGDVRHSHADLAHVRAALGFEPTVSFDDAIFELATDLADKLHEDHSARAEAELFSRGLAARAK